jgi:CTP synthase
MPTPEASFLNTKYIFVTGGVLSGIGKGVVVGSIGKLLGLYGLKITSAKIDPYLNVDAGTMNPIIHGEVFVTDDGGETDMDLGTYERFLNQGLTKKHNITTGQIYLDVIQAERKGDLLGQCVQIIPHITDAIKNKIRSIAETSEKDRELRGEVILVECGGTIGDIESLPFLEAIRQMRLEEGSENTLFIHVTLAPVLDAVGEEKTKPTQHSVQELRRIGIQPDIIVVRSEKEISLDSKKKISLFTSVKLDSIISNPDSPSIYQVPENLYRDGIIDAIRSKLNLPVRDMHWGNWKDISNSFSPSLSRDEGEVVIGLVGKYVSLADSYVSVNHALSHAGAYQNTAVKVEWVDSGEFEKNPASLATLERFHGVLIPGGFGRRGSEGKILAANYARERSIPFLGLCFGFQLALVGFARHVCGLHGAHSTELDPKTNNPVIDLLPSQKGIGEMGASMRLGGHDIEVLEGTLAHRIYESLEIRQRHRHRYEFALAYQRIFEKNGMKLSAFSDSGRRAEILEVPSHPFYMATQYHPEFVSRPGSPEPIFKSFVQASIERKRPSISVAQDAKIE